MVKQVRGCGMDSVTDDNKTKRRDDPLQLGKAIRRRRKALGMTLVQVAEEAGLTTGFISQVERGISSPSLSSLMAIAATLQSSVEEFLSVDNGYRAFIPKDQRQTYALGVKGRSYEKLGPGFPGALCYPSIIHRPPGHVSEQMCHPGEVFCYLMSGTLDYYLGDEIHQMQAGDTIHHDTSTPHHSIVTSEEESVELWISTMPMQKKAAG